jgi:predicted nucleotidyltransferase
MVTHRAEHKRIPPSGRTGRRKAGPSRKVLRILRRMKAHLEDAYGDQLLKVILYGSQARGDAREGSDVDVAVVVKDALDPRKVERSLEEMLWNVVVDDGELVAVIAFREGLFEKEEWSLIQNIKDEGITI